MCISAWGTWVCLKGRVHTRMRSRGTALSPQCHRALTPRHDCSGPRTKSLQEDKICLARLGSGYGHKHSLTQPDTTLQILSSVVCWGRASPLATTTAFQGPFQLQSTNLKGALGIGKRHSISQRKGLSPVSAVNPPGHPPSSCKALCSPSRAA